MEKSVYRTYGNSYETLSRNETEDFLGFLCAGKLSKHGVRGDTINGRYPFYCLVHVIKGKGRYVDDNGRSYPLTPDSLFQRFPGREHSLYIDPASGWEEEFIGFGLLKTTTNICVQMNGDYDFWSIDKCKESRNHTMKYLMDLSVLPDLSCVPLRNKHPEDIYFPSRQLSGLIEELEHCEPEGLRFLTAKVLSLISLAFSGKATNNPTDESDPVRQAMILLTKKPESRESIKSLLATIPLSYSRLRARFHTETGIGPGEYRIRRRIERACSLLAGEGRSSTYIANVLGYPDTTSFARQFRQITRMSPVQYLKTHRGNKTSF